MKYTALWIVMAALSLTPPALARDTPSIDGSTEAAQPNDRELGNFVSAFVRLVGVHHGYLLLMRDEDDPGKLAQLRRSAVSDMKAAVEHDGLSIARYNQIAMAVRSNPDLQGRVEGILQQLAADPRSEE